MRQLFTSFSSSFVVALLVWPFLAALLTLPILVMQYRRYNKLYFWRAASTYLFVLYGLALVSFTLYPMPDNPTQFCMDYHLSPQLIPFASIMEIPSEGMRAIFQVGMNMAFFVPFGVFGRLLFRWKIGRTVLFGFGVSLLIEIAQLTGAFGIYPCSYRLFDVDDLLLNTLGAATGYLLAMLVPQHELTLATKSDVVRKAGLLRYVVAFIIDQITAITMATFVSLGIYFIAGNSVATDINGWIYIGILGLVYLLEPLLFYGWSIGGRMVRLNHDDKQRGFWRRLLFYILRLAYILTIVELYNGWATLFVVVIGVICWHKWKKLPYQFV